MTESSSSTVSRGGLRSSSSFEVDEIEEISGSQLPSNNQVLGFFLFKHKTERDTILVAKMVLKEMRRFYDNLEIKLREDGDIIKKMRTFHNRYVELRQAKNRKRGPTPKEKEDMEKFAANKNNLFDISHYSATLYLNETTKAFLLGQRLPGRVGTMANISTRKRSRDERSTFVRDLSNIREENEGAGAANLPSDSSANIPSDISSLSSVLDSTQNDPSFVFTEKQIPRKNFINDEIIQILDSCKIGNPCAMRILSATLKSFGEDVNRFVLSASTLSRRRHATRKDLFFKVKDEFIEFVKINGGNVQIHWDGKSMKNITGNEIVERLPVKAVCNGREQLLGVPITGKKGIETATTVSDLIREWELEDYISSCCFDSTN